MSIKQYRMATSVKEVYDSIISYKDSRDELKDLNSTSLVAIYNMWAFITAVVIYTHELLWDLFQAEIETSISERINGTSPWYAQKALEYQHEDTLQVLNGGTSLGYDPVIVDNRIVTRAAYEDAIVGSEGLLNLKLAKGDVESLAPLDGAERSGVEKYFDEIKFAGTNINIVSIEADELVLGTDNVTVFHDGVRTSSTVREDLDETMDNFFVNLDFNGVFYIEKFRDALQSVEGVIDVEIDTVSMKTYLPEPPETNVVVRKVSLDSGHGKITSAEKLLLNVEIES